jgi:hypothetical protein
MADFTTRDKVALLKDFLNVVGTETEGVEVKITQDADNGMRFYADPEVVIEVKNATLAQLDAGTPVYVSGTAASGKPEVSPAQANSTTTMPAIGLVQDDIASGAEGFVVAGGLVLQLDTDTPAWDDGTPLYVSPTVAGGLTSTRPTGTTELVQKVALVTRRHPTVGSVIVMGAGRTNDIPNDLVTLTGVSLGDSDLGTFTGTTIADNETIKGALQDLETAVEAGGGVKYHGRYDTEAETARSGATTTTEIYYTARPDGDGYAESEVTTSTPAGFVIDRKLYFSDKFNADPDTASDWTLYTTQPAENTAFATAKASLLAGLSNTDGTANTRGTLPVSLKMEHRFSQDLLLEDFPGAAAAYSLRKISADYTGDAIRIREDGTDTETDIGFDADGNLNTAAIASWCGSNNGFVVTWYDQSGNSRDATAAADSNEPQIYDGTDGQITENGKPAIQWTTSHALQTAATLPAADLNEYSVTLVFSGGSGFQVPAKVIQGSTYVYPVEINSGQYWVRWGDATSRTSLASTDAGQHLVAVYGRDSATTSYAYWDGSQISITNSGRAVAVNHSIIFGNGGGSAFAGKLQEHIVWHSDQFSNRTDIEADISAYWQSNKRTLDAYPGAAAAYSVRKLDNDYTGSALRVREDSGNTETDIGFDSNGDLDTAAIASHCGSANGYVVTWYDQSGSGNDVTQATTTRQPQIYNGSAVITRNGKPAVHFFESASTPTGLGGVTLNVSNRSRTIFSVQSLELTGSSGFAHVLGAGMLSRYEYFPAASGFGLYTQNHRTATRVDVANYVAETAGAQILKVDVANTTNAQIYKNGTQLASVTDNNSNWSYSQWGLGGMPNFGAHASGSTLAEVVMYESDQLTNRTGIEGDINTYFSIYP